MSLAETELTIGGTSFKGVYIAILLSLATTLGGGVWTASSLYSRLEAVEALEIPDIVPLEENIASVESSLAGRIDLIQQELIANDVGQLQGKLAELGVNLKTIADQQSTLLLINDRVIELEKEIETMRATVAKAELMTKDLEDVDSKLKKIDTEIEDLWSGMDYLSNPLN
jgi:DNA repair exonuclease SbcCD ATPase subunit|tara:strand:- start:223 stop:732 length:510 start_codon:yes stop_codon:yes gene_type:complete